MEASIKAEEDPKEDKNNVKRKVEESKSQSSENQQIPQQVQAQRMENPCLQQQVIQQQEPVKMSAKKFLSKIQTHQYQETSLLIKVLQYHTFQSLGKFYVPPQKELTTKFCRQILGGQKKLLKFKDVIWVDQVPNWSEFSTKTIWESAKNNPVYTQYFPDYSGSQRPSRLMINSIIHFNRKYLLNVANTVVQNSVVEAVIEARKKRENKEIEEAPIVLTSEFAQLFENFESISSNQRRRGLNNLREFTKCPLCLSEMRSNPVKFGCGSYSKHVYLIIRSFCPLKVCQYLQLI